MTLLDGENRIESEHSADFENCFLNMSMKDDSETITPSRHSSCHSVIDTTKERLSPKKSISLTSQHRLSVAEECVPLKMPKTKSRIKDISLRLHVASDKRIDSQKSNSEDNITTSRRDSKKNT